MKKQFLIIFLLITFFIFYNGCCKVETGRITTCKICGKELSNTVRVISVPFWEKNKYHVHMLRAYCDVCGNEQVPYTVSIFCKQCGKKYNSYTEYTARKFEQSDKRITEGYCSSSCEKWGKFDKGVDKTSEKVGDFIGRVGKGIADGISKHLK